MILYLNRDPVASGPAQLDQGPTIHGNGTVNIYKKFSIIG
jgi:hypothetical protein